jgi:hypothetical protein
MTRAGTARRRLLSVPKEARVVGAILLSAAALIGCFVAGVIITAHGHEIIGIAIGLAAIPVALAVMMKWSDR